MKAGIVFILAVFFLSSLSAQSTQKDSITSEISTVEKMKSDVSVKVDKLSDQLTQMFSHQRSLKTKSQELTEQIQQIRNECTRLRSKKELTSQDKKRLESLKKLQAEMNRINLAAAQTEEQFNKRLAMLDEVLGLRIELDQKLEQLRAQQRGVVIHFPLPRFRRIH